MIKIKDSKTMLVLLPTAIIIGIIGGLLSGFFIDNWGVENSLTVGLILITGSTLYFTYKTNQTTIREMKKNRYADSIPILLIETPTVNEETASAEIKDIKIVNAGKGIATDVYMSYSWNGRSQEITDFNVGRAKEYSLLVAEKEEMKEAPENSCRIELKYKDIFGNSFKSWADCTIVGEDDIKISHWQYKAFQK